MTEDRLERLDYYTLLQVADDASTDEIRRAFRQFARRYHPDRFAGGSEEKRERAAQIYRRGAEAFEILRDGDTRRHYDAQMRIGRLRMTAEDVDRARAEEKKAPSRDETLVRSPAARRFHAQAMAALERADYDTALRALRAAVNVEPDNFYLDRRLGQVEGHLRRRRQG